MTCAYLAFTSKGLALARKLAAAQPGDVARSGENGVTLANWTAAQFAQSDAIVFVGAVGIAVRAIAPHCRSKATDPAVVVLDECGRFAIPLLSGHLGGANDLARRLAKAYGAEPARIRKVSSALLAGRTVRFASDWPIQGTPPAGVEPAGDAAQASFALTITPTMTSNALHIIPRIAVLGIGCKRGTPADKLADAFAAFCAETKLAPQSIAAAASIDLKKDELGLAEFGQKQGWLVTFYTADELRAVPGQFAHSDFVQSITGVDNVCERAAVLAAGGPVWAHKWARDGVTFAVALRPFTPDWRWNDG